MKATNFLLVIVFLILLCPAIGEARPESRYPDEAYAFWACQDESYNTEAEVWLDVYPDGRQTISVAIIQTGRTDYRDTEIIAGGAISGREGKLHGLNTAWVETSLSGEADGRSVDVNVSIEWRAVGEKSSSLVCSDSNISRKNNCVKQVNRPAAIQGTIEVGGVALNLVECLQGYNYGILTKYK